MDVDPNDSGASVSSQGSRRSARLLEKKRARGDDASTVSPITPKRQRRTTPARSSARRASGDHLLTAIPEEITTKEAAKKTKQEEAKNEPPLTSQQATHPPPPPEAEPPQRPPPYTKTTKLATLPPITPGKLQIASTPAAKTKPDIKSSKKLSSLDVKLDTPFKTTRLYSEENEEQVLPERLPEELPKHDVTTNDASTVEVPVPPHQEHQEGNRMLLLVQQTARRLWIRYQRYLESTMFWLLFFLILQIVMYPLTIHPILSGTASLSRFYLQKYQYVFQTNTHEDQTPRLLELQEELSRSHDQEKQGIRILKRKTTELRNLVQEHITHTDAELQKASQQQHATLTKLSIPKLWTVDQECSLHDNDGPRMSVAQAVETIREVYQSQQLQQNDTSVVKDWIHQHISPNQRLDRNQLRLQKLIAERVEDDRADFDYTDTILASTGNFVDQLPWGNRLMALWGMRFYGNGAEAAIAPTRSMIGQCWALVPPATATIQLSAHVYVQSISIEHPASARADSAIRTFSVVGIDANFRTWPLGSFVYEKNDSSRQDYMVRDKYKGEEIPPLKVVKLIVDSSWGGKMDNHYACLYRFRVFGEEEEVNE